MRTDLREFANDRGVDIRDPKASPVGKRDRMLQKGCAFRILPSRVCRRKVPAYVALCQRAIYRIGDRMHGDVGIRMAGEAAIMGHMHAAERDMIAGTEAMYVETVA